MKEFLDRMVEQINTPDFIERDPVQFPRRYSRLQDVEAVSFVIATISWGRRDMILRDSERLLSKLGASPYDYIMNEDYRQLGSANVHRTFFEPDLACMLRGFRRIFEQHGSLQNFLLTSGIGKSEAPAWEVAQLLRSETIIANDNADNAKCYPRSFETSALKRINLALRWLVRNDGIVDLGVWTVIKPSRLHIPLDVHVAATSRRIGLLSRRNNDRKAVEELTANLRRYCPDDPIKYDFALFGIGVDAKTDSPFV